MRTIALIALCLTLAGCARGRTSFVEALIDTPRMAPMSAVEPNEFWNSPAGRERARREEEFNLSMGQP